MAVLIVIVFILGYILISLENPVRIDKAATALLTGVLCWLVLVFGIESMPSFTENSLIASDPAAFIRDSLFDHIGKIAEILFFLLGAMMIVELVDAHDGFIIITKRINTTSFIKLLWIISLVTFFLSSVLDNLTTAIIMCALLRSIVRRKENLWLLGGFVIIAANAGGAWSPIGDITTIMLWIGGQITALNIVKATFLASATCLIVPLLIVSVFSKAQDIDQDKSAGQDLLSSNFATSFEQKLLFFLGCALLLFVPVFKAITHLPPYMGILLAVGLMWIVTELLHKNKDTEIRRELSVGTILQNIDTPSILFFLGILLAVAALDTSGHLHAAADVLNQAFGNIYFINAFIGLLSSIVDNVPLVAACMGMYELSVFPQDHDFWKLLAYCAGTGGSILIIGSAAGVASMGILKIDFLWYIKRISPYALIGFLAGIGVYYIQHNM